MLRSRNFADLSENLSADVISGTHKTVTDDTVQGKKKKDQKGNNPNLKELKSDSACGYQVFSTTKSTTLLCTIQFLISCITELSNWKGRIHKRSPCGS